MPSLPKLRSSSGDLHTYPPLQPLRLSRDIVTHSIDLLEQWLVEVDTDLDFWECLVDYARGRGGRTMTEICRGLDNRYRRVAEEQDAIGWRRFMEGMICRGLRGLQELYTTVEGSNVSGEQWATRVVIKLLKTTHGQWLYWCIQVHDKFSRIQATQQKEDLQLQMGIEAQQDMGWEDLTKEDQYLAEVNLEDLEHTLGERQEYWLVAIQAAREASRLQGSSQSNVGRRRTARRGRTHTQL